MHELLLILMCIPSATQLIDLRAVCAADSATWLPGQLDAVVAHEKALKAELTALQAY